MIMTSDFGSIRPTRAFRAASTTTCWELERRNRRGAAPIYYLDKIPRCWGSTTAFKPVVRSRTISVGTRRVRACTQLLTTGGPYGTMQGTAQVAGTNKV